MMALRRNRQHQVTTVCSDDDLVQIQTASGNNDPEDINLIQMPLSLPQLWALTPAHTRTYSI